MASAHLCIRPLSGDQWQRHLLRLPEFRDLGAMASPWQVDRLDGFLVEVRWISQWIGLLGKIYRKP